MPTYLYRREDGTTFEVVQRITEDALTVDPETGQRVERIITGAGLIFKGDGFYLTDYARKNGGKDTSTTGTETAATPAKTESSTPTEASKVADS